MPSAIGNESITPAATTAAKRAFRPDIQGLRMVAVVAVILDHLFGWPSGGFTGVDIFFVISGFLITGHLHREHQKSGRISFADFYRKRIRRIMPVATLVLAVTVAASFLIYLPSRAIGVVGDSVWAFLFSANWHFALDGTNYWANDGLESPVQHYWSLAVEEQFYVVWPWLLVVILGVGAAWSWNRRTSDRVLLIVMIGATAASFAWALQETATSPTFAYFSTFSRAWELGVGAVLAVAAPSFRRIPDVIRPVLAWVGLLGMTVGLFVISDASAFPAPWAVVPVVSTAAVIIAGTGGDQRFLFPLTNRVAGYLGDISYSLYLWHWPLIVLLAALLPSGPAYFSIVLALTAALAVLSYHFIENPVRRSLWLDHSAEAKAARQEKREQPRPPGTPGVVYTGVGILAVCASLLAAIALTPPADLSGEPDAVPATPADPSDPPADPLAVPPAAEGAPSVVNSEIVAALGATRFPDFSPSIDSLGIDSWVAEASSGGCADVSADNISTCEPQGDSDLVAAVLGDSFAMAWLPGIRDALEPAGYQVHPLTKGQCPAFSASVLQDGGAQFPACDEARSWAIDYINALQPDIVILASSTYLGGRLASGLQGSRAADEIEAATTATIAALAPSAASVVVLGAPPRGIALQECVTRLSTPGDCVSSTTTDWDLSRDAERSAAESTGATYVDTQLWFCDAAGDCPGFAGATPIRADSGHMTSAYSKRLAPLIAEATLTPTGG